MKDAHHKDVVKCIEEKLLFTKKQQKSFLSIVALMGSEAFGFQMTNQAPMNHMVNFVCSITPINFPEKSKEILYVSVKGNRKGKLFFSKANF